MLVRRRRDARTRSEGLCAVGEHVLPLLLHNHDDTAGRGRVPVRDIVDREPAGLRGVVRGTCRNLLCGDGVVECVLTTLQV